MNGKFWAIVVTFSLVLIGTLLYVGYFSDPEGVCLDSGGCWDYVDKTCRDPKITADAQKCARRAH